MNKSKEYQGKNPDKLPKKINGRAKKSPAILKNFENDRVRIPDNLFILKYGRV
ncbi:hypothetical protein [Kallipyga massiliensis]|uniref:hypothetical protein n=1 Tax=Kallipyga massiliensis TaxID=1472764 RepID=UPI0026ED1C92|nr:hypothetical protein [Kallipyga massiliensis]